MTLMQLNSFLTGLQEYPYLHFGQITISRKEKETFSAKSLGKCKQKRLLVLKRSQMFLQKLLFLFLLNQKMSQQEK